MAARACWSSGVDRRRPLAADPRMVAAARVERPRGTARHRRRVPRPAHPPPRLSTAVSRGDRRPQYRGGDRDFRLPAPRPALRCRAALAPTAFDLSGLLPHEDNVLRQLFAALFGYTSRPEWLRSLVWLGYLARCCGVHPTDPGADRGMHGPAPGSPVREAATATCRERPESRSTDSCPPSDRPRSTPYRTASRCRRST